MAPRALNIYTDHVQEHVIELLVALGPNNPLGNTAEIIRQKFPPQERIFMLIEKLSGHMREFDRIQREATEGVVW